MGVHTKGSVFLHVGKVLELRSGLELRCDLARMPFHTKHTCPSIRMSAQGSLRTPAERSCHESAGPRCEPSRLTSWDSFSKALRPL